MRLEVMDLTDQADGRSGPALEDLAMLVVPLAVRARFPLDAVDATACALTAIHAPLCLAQRPAADGRLHMTFVWRGHAQKVCKAIGYGGALAFVGNGKKDRFSRARRPDVGE